jgi:ABC-type Na+ efflux pump permease subunit
MKIGFRLMVGMLVIIFTYTAMTYYFYARKDDISIVELILSVIVFLFFLFSVLSLLIKKEKNGL